MCFSFQLTIIYLSKGQNTAVLSSLWNIQFVDFLKQTELKVFWNPSPKKPNPSYFHCPSALSTPFLPDLFTLPSFSSSALFSTPSFDSLHCCWRHLFGASDEVCNVKKVRLLDWLIRRLVRIFRREKQPVSGSCLSIKWGGLVCAPTLLKERRGEVEVIGAPCF